MRSFRMFGLQRTCTNLVAVLLLDTFESMQVLEDPWKHGPVDPFVEERGERPVIHVMMVKDPYAWLAACYRYFVRSAGHDSSMCERFKAGESFDRFLFSTHYEFKTPMHRWCEMNTHYLDTADAHSETTVSSRAEDWVEWGEQAKQVTLLQQKFGLVVKDGGCIEGRTDRIGPGFQRTTNEFCVYPYLAEHYLATFTQEMLDAVNEHLSDEALERMGYERKTELPSWVTRPVLPSILPS